MYPDRAGLASRLRCSVTERGRDGRDFEMDAVLNDELQVVVFEEKAAWLKDEVRDLGAASGTFCCYR